MPRRAAKQLDEVHITVQLPRALSADLPEIVFAASQSEKSQGVIITPSAFIGYLDARSVLPPAEQARR